MKYNLLINIIVFACCSFFISCQKDNLIEDTDNPRKVISLDTRQDACNSKFNTFAFSMLEEIEAESGSNGYFFSPLSVEFVLGILANGCSGETRNQICSAIGTEDIDGLNSYAVTMLEKLPTIDKRTKLSLANLVVFDNKVPVNESFKKIVNNNYFADIDNQDLSSPKTVSFINDWASRKTDGLIKNVTNRDALRNSPVFLANAVYFKGLWAGFKFDRIKDQSFTTVTGRKIKVDMLETENPDLVWASFERYSHLTIPFGNHSFVLNIFLPNKGVGIEEMIYNIKEKKECVESGKTSLVRFPMIKDNYELSLSPLLIKLGISDIFNSGDFSDMTSFAPISVSNIIQKSYIEVNEKGTQAAAVTTAYMVMGAWRHDEFIVDRPFLYSITETSTNSILFMGKYSGE